VYGKEGLLNQVLLLGSAFVAIWVGSLVLLKAFEWKRSADIHSLSFLHGHRWLVTTRSLIDQRPNDKEYQRPPAIPIHAGRAPTRFPSRRAPPSASSRCSLFFVGTIDGFVLLLRRNDRIYYERRRHWQQRHNHDHHDGR
jgi:hypothetical protein